MYHKSCVSRTIIVMVICFAVIFGVTGCSSAEQQTDNYESTSDYSSEDDINTQDNTFTENEDEPTPTLNSSEASQNIVTEAPTNVVEKANSNYDYTSSDGNWAVNESYLSGEVNGQKNDYTLYSTDISSQYYGDFVVEVTIMYSDNVTFYLDLNMSKLEEKEYIDEDFYNFDEGSVAKFMYVDTTLMDNSGWVLPAPYCYYHVVTGITDESETSKKFDAVYLKIDSIDYNKGVINAYLYFWGPDVNGDAFSLDGYFAAGIPYLSSNDTNVNDDNYDSSASSGLAGNDDSTTIFDNYTQTCTVCYGTGNCQTCLGSGYYYNEFTGDRMDCPTCNNQDGKCWHCGGTGIEP
jgi:hypothetical protein